MPAGQLSSLCQAEAKGKLRLCAPAQGVAHFKDIRYTDSITYGEMFMQNEYEMGRYNLDEADVATQRMRFELYEQVHLCPVLARSADQRLDGQASQMGVMMDGRRSFVNLMIYITKHVNVLTVLG